MSCLVVAPVRNLFLECCVVRKLWLRTARMLNVRIQILSSCAATLFPQAVLEFRLAYPAVKWRNVYKALTVVDFLVMRGSPACVTIARSDLAFRLQDLALRFYYYEPGGTDHGLNIRLRCVLSSAGGVFRACANSALRPDECATQVHPVSGDGIFLVCPDFHRQCRTGIPGIWQEELVGARA